MKRDTLLTSGKYFFSLYVDTSNFRDKNGKKGIRFESFRACYENYSSTRFVFMLGAHAQVWTEGQALETSHSSGIYSPLDGSLGSKQGKKINQITKNSRTVV